MTFSRTLFLAIAICSSFFWKTAAEGEEQVIATRDTQWKGYTKQSFVIDGEPAFVVAPKVAAAGNPWIWRTSFPDYHSEVDLELLAKGFHVGFINVVKMLGSDSSLDKMDLFYDRVRSQWKLAEKPALEPCSRGGLHAYRYAARHPERIACIFGDVPVMDLKSWPLGHAGAKANVAQVMKYYGFKTRKEIERFQGNPIDLLAPIAKARIPIRHVICLTDKVVPPEANTLEAQRRLKKLGHDMDLVIIKDSKKAQGHHFDMIEIAESAQFVIKYASPDNP